MVWGLWKFKTWKNIKCTCKVENSSQYQNQFPKRTQGREGEKGYEERKW